MFVLINALSSLTILHRSIMATGANTTPLGRIHPVLQGRYSSGNSSSNNLGSKSALNNPDLQAHLEAAKRAASALFPSEYNSNINRF